MLELTRALLLAVLAITIVAVAIVVLLYAGVVRAAKTKAGLTPVHVTILGTKFASSMLFDVGVYAAVLGLVPLSAGEWLMCTATGAVLLVVVEVDKAIRRRRPR